MGEIYNNNTQAGVPVTEKGEDTVTYWYNESVSCKACGELMTGIFTHDVREQCEKCMGRMPVSESRERLRERLKQKRGEFQPGVKQYKELELSVKPRGIRNSTYKDL